MIEFCWAAINKYEFVMWWKLKVMRKLGPWSYASIYTSQTFLEKATKDVLYSEKAQEEHNLPVQHLRYFKPVALHFF